MCFEKSVSIKHNIYLKKKKKKNHYTIKKTKHFTT